MKAATIKEYKADIEITDIDKPALEADSVLIAVHAASINPIDDILRSGQMKDMIPLSFPHVMGYDVSGEIIEVGKNVSHLNVGDAVFARPRQEDAGALAEFARVKASELALKPETLSHILAAAVPLAGLTAWQALISKGELKAGEKVLIHAGSGGVGTFAIQIAKHLGAYVATTCSASNIDLVKGLGADLAIDYENEKFDDLLSDYDLVFDMLGGDTMARSFNVLKEGGRMVSIKGQDSDDLGSEYGVSFEFLFMEPDGPMLAKLGSLIDQGVVKPIIGRTFALQDASAAYDGLNNGSSAGKIVITIQ